MPNNLLIKLILTPIIIAAATLVARRYGERIGGLLIGLPLTSAPVSIFFAVEQGQKFAYNAAKSAILGLIPVAVFCTGYAQSARRLPWYWSAAIGISLYLAAVVSMSLFTPDLGVEAVLVPSVLFLALLVLGRMSLQDRHLTSPWWDLPVRMLIASALVVSITTAAGALGSTWAGLLSPFPVFTFVMATFSHSQGGPAAAGRMMRGVLLGLFAYTAFFVVVALLIERMSLVPVYSLATLVALAINGVSLAVLVWRARRKPENQFSGY
jgi:hypothetical protein